MARGSKESEGQGEPRGTKHLSLTEVPRLPKASESSQAFSRPQGCPREAQEARGEGEQGDKGSEEQGEVRGMLYKVF